MNNILYGLQLKLSLTNIKVEQPYNGETFSTHADSAHVTFLHTSFVLCSLFHTSRLFQSHYIPFITPFHFQNLADRFQCTLCTIIRLVFKTAFERRLWFNGKLDATCVFFVSFFPSCWTQSVATAAPRWRWRGINDVWHGRFFAPSHAAPRRPVPALRNTKHTPCLAVKKNGYSRRKTRLARTWNWNVFRMTTAPILWVFVRKRTRAEDNNVKRRGPAKQKKKTQNTATQPFKYEACVFPARFFPLVGTQLLAAPA